MEKLNKEYLNFRLAVSYWILLYFFSFYNERGGIVVVQLKCFPLHYFLRTVSLSDSEGVILSGRNDSCFLLDLYLCSNFLRRKTIRLVGLSVTWGQVHCQARNQDGGWLFVWSKHFQPHSLCTNLGTLKRKELGRKQPASGQFLS